MIIIELHPYHTNTLTKEEINLKNLTLGEFLENVDEREKNKKKIQEEEKREM